MSIQDLRGFLELLAESGQLCRIKAEVDPELEISAITSRVSKQSGGGKALWFENVKGHQTPVLTNLFGSPQRAAWALWTENVETLANLLRGELARRKESSVTDRLRNLLEEPEYLPRLIGQPPCQEVVFSDAVDLGIIPALKAWPGDGGRFITLPLVYTRDPATGRQNCGMYRVQIHDRQRVTINWGKHSDGARHYTAYGARGKRMPVAIAIGGDPTMIYAATVPLPSGIDEAVFAGFLRQRGLATAKCLSADLEVPAAAEFILEGYLEPGETLPEGPFGNHTGSYTPVGEAAVMHVTTLTHRRNPLYPCTVVGPPPMEDCYLAKATERLFLPLLQQDFPEIVDINMPMEGIFHHCALVAMRCDRPGHGKELLRGLWNKGFLQRARLLLVLDERTDIQNLSESFWKALNRIDPQRDVLIEDGRIGFDATGLQEPGRDELAPSAEIVELVQQRWAEYGIDD